MNRTSNDNTSLALMSEASRMLVEASTIQQAKELKDLALTAADWARRKGMGDEAIQYARSYALRAERKMGEMLQATDRATGTAGRGRPSLGGSVVLPPKEDIQPTLAELGVTKRESSEAQFLASMPEEEFEEVAVGKKTIGKVKFERRMEAKKAQEGEPEGASIIVQQNAIEFLNGVYADSADLLLTDPPYMTDVEDIESFALSWIPLALSRVKPTGRAYICTGAYPREIAAYLAALSGITDFTLGNILVWTYRNTLGPSPKMIYKGNWQAIFYLYGPEAQPLDCPIMTEQFAVQDISAPDARTGDRFHTWEKPSELAERFIRHSTGVGDLVIDPFAGTGTFILAADRLGRKAIGCDNDPKMIQIAINRGCNNAPSC